MRFVRTKWLVTLAWVVDSHILSLPVDISISWPPMCLIAVLPAARDANETPGEERLLGVQQPTTGQREWGGCDRGHVQAAVRPHIPRVLHPRVVHNRKETDVSVLQGEGGLEAYLFEPLGEASRLIRSVTRLDTMARGLATLHPDDSPGNQLGVGSGVEESSGSAACPRFTSAGISYQKQLCRNRRCDSFYCGVWFMW